MCVIAFVKDGVELTEEVTKMMWYANPDGAGFAYYENEKWFFEKGYMKLESLIRRLKKLHLLETSSHPPLVIHFRVTSVGETNQTLTHPFKIHLSNSQALLFHNGTLNVIKKNEDKLFSKYYSYYSYSFECENKMVVEEGESDTSMFAKLLSELRLTKQQLKLLLKKGGLLEPLRNSSRFAICFNGDKEPLLIGKWNTDESGMVVSNTYWKSYGFKKACDIQPSYHQLSYYVDVENTKRSIDEEK